MTEERRVVVVIFAHVVGLAELDDEARLRATDGLFTRYREAIESRGGAVDKFIGDIAMAVFGAPVAHADDAARAVRAALAMESATREYAAEHGIAVAMRAGINTGEVLHGSVAGDRPTVMGDVVNVAKRLQENASAGQVTVAAEVAKPASTGLRFRSLSPVQVKGREALVEVLLAEGEIAGSDVRRSRKETPLVGRSEELRQLEALAARGASGFALLEGEAGVGKSRLLAEFRRKFRALRPGTWVATARASEGTADPYSALAGLLLGEAGATGHRATDAERVQSLVSRDLSASGAGATDAANDAQLLVLSAGLPVTDARVTAMDPGRLAEETRAAWGRWIASRSPALLCIEDVHWAPEATRRLLEALPDALARANVIVVATARPGTPALARYDRLALRDLGPEAALQLARTSLGGDLSPELEAFLVDRSAGHPFYLEELARHLRASGLLEGRPLRLKAAAGELPSNLRGLLVSRLDGASPEGKEALKCASVLGREFWLGILQELLQHDVAPGIADAERRDMILHRESSLFAGDGEYAFRHALIRDAAYSLLTRKDRRRYHEGAAVALEARATSSRRVLALAAAQREAAGDAAGAAKLYADSGTRAMKEHASEEALEYARAAARLGGGTAARLLLAQAAHHTGRSEESKRASQELLDGGEVRGEEAAEAWMHVARADLSLGNIADAIGAARRAAAVALTPVSRLHARLLEADGQFRLADYDASAATARAVVADCGESPQDPNIRTLRDAGLRRTALVDRVRGRTADALRVLQAVVTTRREAADLAGEACALGDVGGALSTLARFDEAAEWSRQATDIYRSIGDRRGVASILIQTGVLDMKRGDFGKALESLNEAAAMGRLMSLHSITAQALNNIGELHRQQGNGESAREAWEQALVLRRRAGERADEAAILSNLGLFELGVGRTGRGRELQEQSLAIRREIGDRDGIVNCLVNIALACMVEFNYEKVLECLGEGLELARAAGNRASEARLLNNLGEARMYLSDLGGAREAMESSLAIRRAIGDKRGCVLSIFNLLRLLLRTGEAPAARRAVEEGIGFARATRIQGDESLLVASGAMLERDFGDPAAAAAMARQAVELGHDESYAFYAAAEVEPDPQKRWSLALKAVSMAEESSEFPNVIEFLPLAIHASLPGHPAEAATLAARLEDLGTRARMPFAQAVARIAGAWIEALAGRSAGAADRIQACVEVLRGERWPVRDRLRGFAMAAEALAAAGAAGAARDCVAEGVTLATRLGAAGWQGIFSAAAAGR